jgi:hypothetical protein
LADPRIAPGTSILLETVRTHKSASVAIRVQKLPHAAFALQFVHPLSRMNVGSHMRPLLTWPEIPSLL